MEKILLTYFPDRKNEIESWMNEVLMSLEPPGSEMDLRSLPDFSGLPVLPDKEMKLSIERPQVHPDIAKEPVEKVREPMKGREFSLGSRNLMKNLPPIPEV